MDSVLIAAFGAALLASVIGGFLGAQLVYRRAGKALEKEADELRKVHAATLRILHDTGLKAHLDTEGNFLEFVLLTKGPEETRLNGKSNGNGLSATEKAVQPARLKHE